LLKKKYIDSQTQCGCQYDKCHMKYKTFKELADLFVFYLAYNPTCESLTDYLFVVDALCEIIKQRISIDKIIRKECSYNILNIISFLPSKNLL